MAFDQEYSPVGVDTYSQPNRLKPGFFQQCDNVLADGGALVSRPGWQGQFGTPSISGAPLWGMIDYRQANGSLSIIYASGPVSGTIPLGRLWRWPEGALSPSEILRSTGTIPTTASFAFVNGGQGIRLARHGQYLYGCDSGNGSASLFRVNLEGAITGGQAQAYTGLNAPNTPVVSLTNSEIDPLDGTFPSPPEASNWWSDTVTGSGFGPFPTWHGGTPGFSGVALVPNGNFNATVSGETILPDTGGSYDHYTSDLTPPSISWAGWDFFGTSNGFHGIGSLLIPAGFPAGINWLLLDVPNNGIQPTSFIANTPYSPESSTNCTRVAIAINYFSSDTTSTNGTVITVKAYDNSTPPVLLGFQTRNVSFPYVASPTGLEQLIEVFDFQDTARFATSPQIAQWKFSLVGGATNTSAVPCFLSTVIMYELPGDWTITDASPGVTLTHYEPNPFIYGSINGTRVVKDYGANTAIYSLEDTILLPITGTLINAYIAKGLAFVIGFRADGSTTTTYSPNVVFPEGSSFAEVDVSAIAQSLRSAFRYFEILFTADLTLTASATVFTIGDISSAGNGAVGDSYTYYVVEQETVNGPADVILSEGALSNVVVPTTTTAEFTITAAPPVNPQTDTLLFYRGGGAISDGFWRLIATVPVSADAVDPNGFWSWNHTTRTLTDNTSDGVLIFTSSDTDYQENRDQFPVGLTSLAVRDGRLWAATGATVYVSWLLDTDSEAGLYTSLVNDPSDPSLAIKGASFTLGSGNEADPVLSLTGVANAMVALRMNVITSIYGSDPTTFAAVDQYRDAGLGSIAPRSAVVDAHFFAYGDPDQSSTYIKSDPQVAYLAQTGVIGFNLDVPRPMSQNIEGYLNPSATNQDVISQAVYGLAAQVYFDRRRFLFAPAGSGVTINTVVYVWDARTSGWVRWNSPVANFTQFTGGVSTGPNLYVGGFDGQIYKLAGTADSLYPGAAVTPISVAVVTRKWGQDSTGQQYFYENRGVRTSFEFDTLENITVPIATFGGDFPDAPYTIAWQADPDGSTVGSYKVGGAIRGVNVWVAVTPEVTEQFTLRSVALNSVEARRR